MDILIQLLIALILSLNGGTPPEAHVAHSYMARHTVDGFDGYVWVCDPDALGYDVENLTWQDAEELKRLALDVHNDVAEVCYYGHDENGEVAEGP